MEKATAPAVVVPAVTPLPHINHPSYYQAPAEISLPVLKLLIPNHLLKLECIQAIEALDLGFAAGSVLKYLWRAGDKGNVLEDLHKARWYLDRCLNHPRMTGLGKPRKALELLDQIIHEYSGFQNHL